MSPPATILCKPTRWFIFRALVMLLMFSAFAVLFLVDGATGYRKKNEIFYLHKAFQKANEEFSKMDQNGTLDPVTWKNYAARQSVDLPPDRSVLPAKMAKTMPWPAILHDYERMRTLQWNVLWREYTKGRGLNETAPAEPYDARKIKEQWVVFWACSGLSLTAAFFLIRTLRRQISADAEAITDQLGRRVPYADLQALDLRKWDTKGLAFIDYEGTSGKGRIRIDGLTYGGFKQDDGEPAEKLMQLIRSRFSGEVIEYAAVPTEGALTEEAPAPEAAAGPKTG
ncbi:MAG: hypothetical protein WCS43_14100 [Verrucomicrobiota bacterium]